jgi:predicted transcriptional regulator of viral defense system
VKTSRGPEVVAISHATALALYGISDANPPKIHLTVARSSRLRRETPKPIVVHREELAAEEIVIHEGIPVTSVARTVADLLASGARIDLVSQAVSDARREGFIQDREATRLRRLIRTVGRAGQVRR